MRFAAFLTIAAFIAPLAAPQAARAQSWPNETGPGGDLLVSSGRQFDRLRQAEPLVAEQGTSFPVAAGRPVIPMLDWAPPPAVPPAARAPQPRVVRRAAPRPAPAAEPTPAAAAPDTREWERTLAERERELETLRRRVEEDRRRFEAQRISSRLAPAPVQPPAPPVSAAPR